MTLSFMNCFSESSASEVLQTDTPEPQLTTEETLVPGPPIKSDHGARPKIPSYPQTRRPAGGMSRPLPSPGKIQIHQIIFDSSTYKMLICFNVNLTKGTQVFNCGIILISS